jgi:hypothetical protein
MRQNLYRSSPKRASLLMGLRPKRPLILLYHQLMVAQMEARKRKIQARK